MFGNYVKLALSFLSITIGELPLSHAGKGARSSGTRYPQIARSCTPVRPLTKRSETDMDDNEYREMRERQEKIAVGGIFLGFVIAYFVNQGLGALLTGGCFGFVLGRQR